MLSGRYWSHIQDSQDFIKRIFIICRCSSFPKSIKRRTFENERFIRIACFLKVFGFSWFFRNPDVSNMNKHDPKMANEYYWSKKNECFLAAVPDLGFCTPTLNSFVLLPNFLHLPLRFIYIYIYIVIGPSVPKLGFRVDLLPPQGAKPVPYDYK